MAKAAVNTEAKKAVSAAKSAVSKNASAQKEPKSAVKTESKAKAEKDVKVEKATESKSANKEKKERKVVPAVTQMKNSEMAELFRKCGCATHTKANDASGVVYNTFGTKSRVLQQNKAYQLLLTNGHKMVKDQLTDCDNDDTARFIKFYKSLSKDEQGQVSGFDKITETTLSKSELPRERTVKLTNYDLLVKFLEFMATFDENKVAVKA